MKLLGKIAYALSASAIIVLLSASVAAQRKITPVKTKPATAGTVEQEKEYDPKDHLAETKDAQGNTIFVDTLTGKEWVDTTLNKTDKRMQYPLWESVTVGVNIWDPVMKIFGQDYGGIDVWGELSLHNRYKPVFEFGLGSCNETPDGKNYTYKTPMAPYFRLGMNYNMFYNNDPRYQLVVGVRYGFTTFKYEITEATLNPGYWGEDYTFSVPQQSSTAGFFELVAGVRVQIFKQISLGWTVKYHSILHESKNAYGEPMYIPGYGKRGGSFAGSFSISYTLPLNKKPDPSVNNDAGTSSN